MLMDLGVVWMPQGIVHLDVWKLLSPQLSVTIFAAWPDWRALYGILYRIACYIYKYVN